MKKLIIAILCVLVVGVATCTGIFAVQSQQPENVMKNSLNNAVVDLMSREEFEMFESSGKFSLDVAVEMGEDKKYSGTIFIDGVEVMIKDLNIGEIAQITEIYAGDRYLYIDSEELLGGAYGVDVKTAGENFYGSDIKHMLRETLGDNYVDGMQIILDAYKDHNFEEARSELKKIFIAYENELFDLAEEHGEFVKEKETITINGEEVEVDVVSLTIDAEAVAGILEGFYEFMAKDDLLPDFMHKYDWSLEAVGLMMGQEQFTDPDAMYDSLLDSLEKMISEENIEKLKESMGDTEYKLAVATKKGFSNELYQIAFSISSEENETSKEFILDIGEGGLKETDTISFKIRSSLNGVESENEIAKIKIDNEEKDRYVLTAEIYIGATVAQATFDWNKEAGTYLFSVKTGATDVLTKNTVWSEKPVLEASGKLVEEKKEIQFTLESIKMGEKEVTEIKVVSITLTKGAKMPKLNKDFTDIFTLTKEELEDLVKKVTSK